MSALSSAPWTFQRILSLMIEIGARNRLLRKTKWSSPANAAWRGAESGFAQSVEPTAQMCRESLPATRCASDKVAATDPAPPAREKLRWTTDGGTRLR